MEGDYFDLSKGITSEHSRILDLNEGILKRSFIWENSCGRNFVGKNAAISIPTSLISRKNFLLNQNLQHPTSSYKILILMPSL
ncbi:hypothetical protein ACTPD5_21550, partial [Clostridioides difficile]|uniref:hypothetical protein n=1 Tax=Clostridioides difficile TaxID=1496 RepID=UPI003F8D86EE